MKILVVNAGSSSLKYQLFDMPAKEPLAKGLCSDIGVMENGTPQFLYHYDLNILLFLLPTSFVLWQIFMTRPFPFAPMRITFSPIICRIGRIVS